MSVGTVPATNVSISAEMQSLTIVTPPPAPVGIPAAGAASVAQNVADRFFDCHEAGDAFKREFVILMGKAYGDTLLCETLRYLVDFQKKHREKLLQEKVQTVDAQDQQDDPEIQEPAVLPQDNPAEASQAPLQYHILPPDARENGREAPRRPNSRRCLIS